MAVDQFANNAQTTLNGAITSGAASIIVQSATGFSSSPQFRILIDSELLLVTAVAGTTWTVTRGIESTTAAAHANGAAVIQVLTAAAVTNLESAATAVLTNQSANAVFAGPPSGAAAAPAFRSLVVADLPTVPVSGGGTGQVTLTAHAVLLGEGTSGVASASPGSAGNLLVSQGGSFDPAFQAMNGDVTITSAGVASLKNTGAAGAYTKVTTDAQGRVSSGTTLSASDLPTVDAPHGGTGQTTLTAHGVLVGNGTGAVTVTGAGSSGQILTSNGASADPTFQALPTVVPSGMVALFAGGVGTPPSGWLVCDGSAVSRTTYAALFTAIGTTWGAGNGSTTFNVPDLRDRVPIGVSPGSLSGNRPTAQTLGQTGGEETHTLTTTEMPLHTHGINLAATSGLAAGTNYNLSADTGFNTTSTGGGAAHNNMQPFAVLNYLIKT